MAKRRNKHRKVVGKRQPAASAAKQYIRKHGNALTGLEQFKTHASTSQVKSSLPDLLKIPAYASFVWPSSQTRQSSLKLSKGFGLSAEAEANIAWISETLRIRTVEISEFQDARDRIETLVLCSEFEKALAELDEVDKKFGMSLWAVDIRLNLIREVEGSDEVERFVNSYGDDFDPLVRYLIFWLNYRSSQRVTATTFFNSIEKEFTENSGLYGIIKLFLGSTFESESKKLLRSIGRLDMFPLIDRFVLFKKFIANHLAAPRSAEELHAIAQAIAPLVRDLKDPDLQRIALTCGLAPSSRTKLNLTKEWDLYSQGDYEECLSSIEGRVPDKLSFQAICLGIRAESQIDAEGRLGNALPEDSIASQIYSDFQKILRYKPDAIDAVGKLHKLALVHTSLSWSAELLTELSWSEVDARVHPSPRGQRFHSMLTAQENAKSAFVLDQISPGAGAKYLKGWPIDGAASITRRGLLKILEGKSAETPVELDNIKSGKLKSIASIREGDFQTALVSLRGIEAESDSPIERVEVGLLQVHCLVAEKDWHSAAEIAAGLLLKSPFASFSLPVTVILEGVEREVEQAENLDPKKLGYLPMVVLSDFAARLLGGSQELRFDAFQDFLMSEEILRPSEIVERSSEFDQSMIEYFLARVCVPEVLDQCFSLGTTEEVENERAKLIVALTSKADNDRSESYSSETLEEELQNIRMRQAVRDTQRQLDQSKIYVNVGGIRANLGEVMIENWNRYRVLLIKAQSDKSMLALEKEIQDRYNTLLLFSEDREAVQFLSVILQHVASEFSLSKEFGLNSNLSTNVRHGSMMRELRGPLARRKLVTNKETEESGYSESDLIKELGFSHSVQKRKSGQIIKKLSEDVDGIIDHLNDELLRIKSEQYPDGLFEYVVTDEDVVRLHQRSRSIGDYDEFLNVVFEWLWNKTDKNLGMVRNALANRIEQRLDEAIAKAMGSAEELSNSQGAAELSRLLGLAREDQRISVHRVVDWFTRAKDQAFADYSISVAFEAGIATVQSYYAELEITSDLEGDWTNLLAGWTLPAITKLFSLLVENAAKHSGITAGTLKLHGEIDWDDNKLSFLISNPLGSDMFVSEIEKKAEEINQNYRRDKATDAVALEGGSGFAKVWNLLEHDLSRQHAIQAEVDNHSFQVQIVMNLEGARP